jgi:hypothetical protein
MLDNIGINPVGAVGTPLLPASGMPLTNPFPYGCYVTVAGVVSNPVTQVALNGVTLNVQIASGNQKWSLVKAGGSIAISYPNPGPTAIPTWIWVGL